ncbi:30S ribosomal protein S2 [Candidatus Peregrinibacteria bacterium]|nr:30S ribosomal protein S2 [Candidatus Peregrinibacteria bacterium]
MTQTLVQELFDHAVHIGHISEKWNPKMRSFIYGKKFNVHIFDLEKTAVFLERACQFLEKSSKEGRVILLVSTKPQCDVMVKEAAKECDMPYVTGKWISGLLTNFETIQRRIRYLIDLEKQEATGEFDKYTKKERLNLKKTMEKLENALGGVKCLKKLPDVVVVFDTVRDAIAVAEADRLHIPLLGIVDTNADPEKITYPIPANDDSVKSLRYLVNTISSAIQKGKKSS